MSQKTEPNAAAPVQPSETPVVPTPVTESPNEANVDDGGTDVIDFTGFGDEGSLSDDGGEAGGGESSQPGAGGDAGSVTPSPTPTPSPSETPVAKAPEPAAETPKPSTPEAPKPGEPAKPATPAEATPAKPEAAVPPTQEPATPTQQTGEQSGDLLGTIRQELDKNRDVYVDALADKVYGMTKEESEALFQEPEKVLPKLAARVHVEAVQNVLATLAQVLPMAIHNLQQVQTQQKTLLDDFWNSVPTLDRVKDAPIVNQMIQNYRQMNPNAPYEELKAFVGSQAMTYLKKFPVAGGTPTPVTPSATAKPGAFMPAGNSPTGTPTPQLPAGEVDWGQFSEDLSEVGG